MWPTRKFEHLDELFSPGVAVAADHPMTVLRPDLFTNKKPANPRTDKE